MGETQTAAAPLTIRITPQAMRFTFNIIASEGAAPTQAALVFRPMTHGERSEFSDRNAELARRLEQVVHAAESGAQESATDGAAAAPAQSADATRAIVEFNNFAARTVAALVVKAEGLVSDGEILTWPADETERLDLLVRLGPTFTGKAFDFVLAHCAGLGAARPL